MSLASATRQLQVRDRNKEISLRNFCLRLIGLIHLATATTGALYGYGVRTRADLLALNGLDMERLRIACGLEFETALTLLAKLSEIEVIY